MSVSSTSPSAQEALFRALLAIDGTARDVANSLADGASPNRVDSGGYPPLHVAVIAGWDETHRGQMRALIAAGADLEARAGSPPYETGMTPLHLASHEGHISQMECLIEHGANVNSRTDSGMTPLMLSAAIGDDARIDLLLRHGARAELASHDGKTAGQMLTTLIRQLNESTDLMPVERSLLERARRGERLLAEALRR